jgi:hypothetical protein
MEEPWEVVEANPWNADMTIVRLTTFDGCFATAKYEQDKGYLNSVCLPARSMTTQSIRRNPVSM